MNQARKMRGKPSGISQEECQEHFMKFDRDGNGYISSKELGDCLRSLGYHLEEKQLKELMNDFDTNKDGKIEFQEFYHVVSVRMKNPLTEDELREAFEMFDLNHNGKLDTQELKKALTKYGEALTDSQVDEFLEDADTNGDGFLDIHELTRFLLRQHY